MSDLSVTPDRSRPPRRRRTDHEPQRGWTPVIVIAAVVALLDWGTKAWVASRVALGEHVVVWPERVALWHVRNRAMILGLWGDLPLSYRKGIAVVAAVVALVVISQIVVRGHRLLPQHRPWAWAFAGLALGGMLGNLGERVVHWGVTDYLSFRWGELWLPPGNVADLALFLSVPLCAVVIVLELRARAQRGKRTKKHPRVHGTVPLHHS